MNFLSLTDRATSKAGKVIIMNMMSADCNMYTEFSFRGSKE